MGKRFLREIVSPFQTLTASADITPVDLPVNPTTHYLLTLQGTQVTETAAGLYSALADFMNTITALSVRHKGEQIIGGSLTDVAVLNARVAGLHPAGVKFSDDLAKVRSVTFPLSFSRRAFWHEEAFPATQRGNLRFFMTAAALQASFSAVSWQLEAVQLIEDNPTRYLKYVTNTRQVTVSGQFDAPLPIGNPYAGILLFDPEPLATDAAAYIWGQVKLLKDDVEQYYVLSDWESLTGSMNVPWFDPYLLFDHRHTENLAAAYAQFANTGPQKFDIDESPSRYGYMDFDPLQDGSYLMETDGAADLKLRGFADAGATFTATARYLPVELVSVAVK
jgi:hypothetical protein